MESQQRRAGRQLTPLADGEWDHYTRTELLLGEMSLSCSCLSYASKLWFVMAPNLNLGFSFLCDSGTLGTASEVKWGHHTAAAS